MKFERLGNICTVRNGYAFKSELFNEDGVPVIRISDINGNYVTSENSIRTPYNEAFEQFKLSKGDILIAMSGATTGKYGIYSSEEVGYQNQRVGCFVIKDKSALDNNYLLQTLKYLKPKIERKAHGSGQPNISAKAIEDFEILLPPLPDQLHIANVLSKAENLIAQRKESIRLLDEFLKSTFLEMFGDPVRNEKGWDVFSLSEICTKITDGTHDTPERLTQGVKYITGKHITPFNIDFENSDYVTEEVHKEIYRRTNVEFDDILYTNIGANVGTAARVKVKYEFSLKNVALLKHDRDKLKSHFLEHLLNLSNFKHKLLSLLSIGGAQKFLNLKSIGKIKIPVPPIELQTQFAQIVEKTEALKTQYQQSLQELENLYGGLSQKAFRGELSIKEDNLMMAAEPNIEYKTL